MCNLQVEFMILMAVFCTTDCSVFPAGKCKFDHIDIVSIDLNKEFVANGKMDILYGPEIKGHRNIARTDLVITPTGKDSFMLVNTRYFKDKMMDKNAYVDTLVDGVIVEDAIGVGRGSQSHFRIYPLAETSEGAILFYRCADDGREGESVDTRFIVIPAGRSLSDAGLKYLLEVDKKFGFQGSLYKFS